jgi:hypothetical protein
MKTTNDTTACHGTARPLAGRLTVAKYLSQRIAELAEDGVKQIEIAELAGFDKPNIITMIKQGKTRLPLDRIGLVARALKIDPRFLFELTLREYEPGLWRVAKDVFETDMFLTAHEQRLVEQLRASDARLEVLTLDEFDDRAAAAVACFVTTDRLRNHLPQSAAQ